MVLETLSFGGKDCVLCVKYIVLTQQQFQESRNEIPEIAAPSIFRILKLLFLAHFQEYKSHTIGQTEHTVATLFDNYCHHNDVRKV